jgi:NADH-quinone oxidoreductase subunit M
MAIPLLGAALIATLPQSKSLLAKQFALVTTLISAVATIFMTTKFERSNTALQFVESYDWIKAFGIKYAVGVDGIALVLILMTALLTPIVVLAGWNESEGGREH